MRALALLVNVVVAAAMITGVPAAASDVVRVEGGHSARDTRVGYKVDLIRAALKATEDTHGPFLLDASLPAMPRDRTLRELVRGHLLNVHIAPTKPDLEAALLTIRVPVLRGLLDYRLLLIHADDRERFNRVRTVEDLKRLRVGLRSQWSTTQILEAAGFDVVQAQDYDGVFTMLEYRRSDFLPRGINEVFGEMEAMRDRIPHVIIEPRLALNIPLPSYVFVSPRTPRLAERVESGLRRMIADGRFDALFQSYFGDDIRRAGLAQRHVIRLPNPFLSERKAAWLPEDWCDPYRSE